MKNSQKYSFLIFVIFLLLLANCQSEKKAQWKGKITKEGDVEVVHNPDLPLYPEGYLQLEEDLSLDGTSGSEESLLASIRSVVVDEGENIYILDSEEDVIKVFDKEGKYLRTIGAPGQGPGELSSPTMLSLFGDTILVHEASRRLSFFKTNGEFIRSLSTKEHWVLQARCDSQGNIIVVTGRLDPENPAYEYLKFDPDFNFLFKLTESPAPSPAKGFNPFMAVSYFVVGPGDQIIYGYPVDYTIQVYSPEGKLIRKITREYVPVEVSEEEKKEWERENPPDVKLAMSKYHSAYRRFKVDEDGHLYVETWEKDEAGNYYYDVFDEEGRYLTRLSLKGVILEVTKGKLYCREEDEEGYHFLKRYRLVFPLE